MSTLGELLVKVGADISEFSRKMKDVNEGMKEVASNVSQMGAKVGRTAGLAATAIAPLIPMAGGLASSFASAGVGAIGFGAVAVGVLGDVFDAASELEKLDEKLLKAESADEVAQIMKERELVLASLSETQRQSVKDLANFKTFWGDFTKEFEKPIGQAFSTSLDILKQGLEVFKPAIHGVANAFNDLLSKVSKGFDSTEFKSFVEYVNTTAGSAFSMFGQIAANTFMGVFNLLTAFKSEGVSATQTILNMTEKFRSWTASLKDSSGFQTLMTVCRTVGTVIGEVVGTAIQYFFSMAQSIMPVVQALSPIIPAVVGIWNVIKATLPFIQQLFTTVFQVVAQVITAALNVVVPFVKEKLAQIKQFWDENGTQIMAACKNAFEGIKKIIEFVMPLVLAVIKMVWGNIKGVIDGALNVIMGLIKVFAGVFTGDWKKMWEGIKQFLGGAVEFIWNLINLMFIGRIIKGIGAFVKAVVSSIKSFGTSIINSFKSTWNNAFNLVDDFIEAVKTLFNLFKARGESTFNAFKGTVLSIWNSIKTGVVNLVTGLKDGAISAFNGLKSTATSIFNGVKSAITNPIETAKNTVLKIIETIKGAFSKMKITIPKPKLPKVSVSMKKGAMGIPYPDFDISWNAKGGIFNGASILGGGQGVGEKGAEAVLPIQHKRYMRPFANAVAAHMDSMKSDRETKVENNFNIASLVVREEADVQRIARELHSMQKRTNRSGR